MDEPELNYDELIMLSVGRPIFKRMARRERYLNLINYWRTGKWQASTKSSSSATSVKTQRFATQAEGPLSRICELHAANVSRTRTENTKTRRSGFRS